MHRRLEAAFSLIIRTTASLSFILLLFIIFFILKESLVFFNEVPLLSFLLGSTWRPVSSTPTFSIYPIIASSIFVTLIAIIIAAPVGIGCALFLSHYLGPKARSMITPYINILAGIPSVVYGFVGFMVVVGYFEAQLSFAAGETILAGGIVLAIMILPFIISTCDESMVDIRDRYTTSSQALGVTKWYMATRLTLPASSKGILAAIVLGIARAMGETMAVMMVIGNAPILPKLLGKGQTIPSLIALEMGGAQVGSLHYHGLFAAGLVLMMLLLCINVGLYLIRRRLEV